MDETNSVYEVELEPITDELLEEVLGGIGDEDGITNSCSSGGCSNTC